MQPTLTWMLLLSGFLISMPLTGAESTRKKPAPVTQKNDVVGLSERAKKSVVIIRQAGRDGKQDGMGAGVIISGDGLIATCFHVIGESRAISIELSDGRRFDATEIHASDRKLDLAIVRIQATGLPALRLGDSALLKQGESVLAMGNPAGLEHSVVQGVVSAKREIEGMEMIQLAIPIEHGNSGGPLLDLGGKIQGLLSMKSAVTANLGFAVPVSALQRLLDRPNPITMERWLNLGVLDPDEWKPVLGATWRRKAGRIQVENPGDGFGGRSLCLWQKELPLLPLELSVAVRLEDESGAAGLAFLSDGGNKHYGFYATGGQLRLTRFSGPDVFSWTILKDIQTAHYRPGEWNTIRIRVEQEKMTGFVNDEKVLEFGGPDWKEGRVGLAKFRDTRAQFRNFHVGTKAPEALVKSEETDWPKTLSDAVASARNETELLEKVKQGGEPARTALLDRARKLELESQQMRRLASGISEKAVQASLTSLLNLPEEQIDLFHAALLVSKLDNPDLDVDAYRVEITRMASELRTLLEGEAEEARKVAALTRYLFLDQGFHGSRADFYNRANSYINEVLEDREGIPITLAVVYLELARLTGLKNLDGIPLPTRFMVRYQPVGRAEELIDVFDGGKVLNRTRAAELVADNVDAVTEKDFAPARKREIISRMLHNLLGIAQRGGRFIDALRYLDTLIAVDPNSSIDRLSRARIHMQRGNRAAAREDVGWLLEQSPQGVDLQRLRELFDSL